MGSDWRSGAKNVPVEKLESLVVGSIYDKTSLLYVDWVNGDREKMNVKISGIHEAISNEGFYDIYQRYQLDSFSQNILGFSINVLKNIKGMYPNLKKVKLSGKVAKGYRENFEELGYEVLE